MKLREDYGGLTGAQVKIQNEEFETIKMQLYDLFKLNVYNLDNQQHIDQLYSFCIDYFSD